MNLRKLPILITVTMMTILSGCGSIESAAQDDCTSIGWVVGSKGYQDCFKARVYERQLDYSSPPGAKPSPSLL